MNLKLKTILEERELRIKSLKTHYKVWGQGTPFLILHGWGSNSDRWQRVGKLLAGNGLIIVIPDLPGFGKTQEPPLAWGLDNYVEWLNEFTEKVPELNHGFYLLGYSFGGTLAAKFAINYLQKIEKLFIVSASCIRKKTFVKKILAVLARVIRLFSFIPGYQNFRKAFYKYIIKKSDYIYQSGIMKDIYLNVISDDLSEKLRFIKSPTVIIWGDKDNITPMWQADIINQKIAHSKMVVIKEANHFLNVENPEVLSQKITENL